MIKLGGQVYMRTVWVVLILFFVYIKGIGTTNISCIIK